MRAASAAVVVNVADSMPPAASSLRLGYCTNVHPAETPADLVRMIRRHVAPVHRRAGTSDVGLRIGAAAAFAFDRDPAALDTFAGVLAAHRLSVFTLNGFPFGDFHAESVKEAVYAPDWSTPERGEYTMALARIAARIAAPEDPFASISTVPLGLGPGPRTSASHLDRLVDVAVRLESLTSSSGVRVVLALEPEPLCALETADDAVRTFEALDARARVLLGASGPSRVRERVGVCFDVCHQAVMGEDPAAAIATLRQAGVPIYKAQLSNALRASAATPEAAAALFAFAEPRFLHQTMRLRDGAPPRLYPDLADAALAYAAGEIRSNDELRCHFHVPIHAEAFPPLDTTRHDLVVAAAALREDETLRHYEVETYTFDVLPEAARPGSLADHLVAELAFARTLLY